MKKRPSRRIGLSSKAFGFVLVISMISALLASSDPAAAAEEAPLDPTSLEAPEAPEAIVMDCLPGQINVNDPDPEVFAGLLTPDGSSLDKPVRARLVSGQPYLQPSDIIATSGIWQDHYAIWEAEGSLCAEPPTLPPPAPDVCVDDQVDINDAENYEQFADLFGEPTADRLVAGLPYPTVWNGLRTAGVGPGGIKKHQDSLCATPWPIIHDGTTWGWADDEGIDLTATGVFGDYSLVVPANTVGTPTWSRVAENIDPVVNEELDEFDLSVDVPSADAHIYGEWDGPVALHLPSDPTDLEIPGTDDQYFDIAVHHAADGMEVFLQRDIAYDDDGRVTIALDDLSIVDVIKTAARWAKSSAATLEQTWRNSMGLGTNVSCSPDLTGQSILPDGTEFSVASDMFNDRLLTPPLRHCVTDGGTGLGGGYPVQVTMGNNRGGVIQITSANGISISDYYSLSSIPDMILTATSGGTPMIPPGSTFTAEPTWYSGSFSADMNTPRALGSTFLYYIIDEVAGLIPHSMASVLLGILYVAPNCLASLDSAVQSASASADVATVAGAIGSAVITSFNCAFSYLETVIGDPNAVHLLANLLAYTYYDGSSPTIADIEFTSQLYDAVKERLKRALLALKIAKYVTVAVDVLATIGLNDDVVMQYKPPAPPLPEVDSEGRAIVPRCVSQYFSYSTGWSTYVDDLCQDFAHGDYETGPTPPGGSDAPIVNARDDWNGEITSLRMYNVLRRDADGILHLILLESGELVAHPISSGDEWSFKQDWPEDEWRSDEFESLIDRRGDQAVNDPLYLRDFTYGRGGNWLLRQADGTAWYINGDGIRVWLETYADQEAVSNNVLTYHPAQFANDICWYYTSAELERGGIKVC